MRLAALRGRIQRIRMGVQLMSSTDVIALFALVISLASGAVTAWVTYHATRSGSTSNSYTNATAMGLEISRMVVTYPEVRPFLYDNAELDDADPHRNRVLAAAELVLDCCESIWEKRDEFTLGPEAQSDRNAWRMWILDLFESSPVLARMFEDNRDWYPHLCHLKGSVQSDGTAGSVGRFSNIRNRLTMFTTFRARVWPLRAPSETS
jgi:hypothetical protein